MNHDRAFCRGRLLGLALQIERGQLDAEFNAAAPAADVKIADMRAVVVRRIRQLADAIESPDA